MHPCPIKRLRLLHLAPWISAFPLAAQAIHSQGCNTMPPASDFKVETLSTDALGNPMAIAVAPDLKVYWVERYGDFKMYDPVTKATRLIKHFDVLYDIKNLKETGKYISDMESGLEGITLDGNFASNHWVYLWYAVPSSRLPAPMVGGKPGGFPRNSHIRFLSTQF